MTVRTGAAPGQTMPGRLQALMGSETIAITDPAATPEPLACASLLASHLLQDQADYRGALQRWFAGVQIGGTLLLTVPHAFLEERQLALPVRARPQQRRLYTPAALMEEVEEALAPNSYRVRLLADDDAGYDYDADGAAPRSGRREIVLALEKLAPPAWELGAQREPVAGPDYAFEPARTRIETTTTRTATRILALKLDHLGDFVLGLPALERLRAVFPTAHITLAVGSWNLGLAEQAGVADAVVAFDAFPRNSAEEEVDVPGKRALFAQRFPERYDLAIDLRTDGDTRTLLGQADAAVRAGLGSRADHPLLDIALPLAAGRIDRERAWEHRFDHHAFSTQNAIDRLPHRARFMPDRLQREGAIVWGPYHRLAPGRYLFDPFLEIDHVADGLLELDVAVNIDRVVRRTVTAGDGLRLEFDVTEADSAFEFRIFWCEDAPAPAFSFYGGRLVRAGAPGLLHQLDYLLLLVDHTAHRMQRLGLLTEVA